MPASHAGHCGRTRGLHPGCEGAGRRLPPAEQKRGRSQAPPHAGPPAAIQPPPPSLASRRLHRHTPPGWARTPSPDGRRPPAPPTGARKRPLPPSLPARRSQDGIPPARTPAERGSVAAAPVTERQELRGLGGRLSRQLGPGPGPGPDQSLAASHRWQGPPEGASPAAPTSRWQSPRSSPPAPPRALPPLAFQCRQGAAVATALSSGSRACWARPGRDLKEQTLFPPPFSSCRPTRAAPPWAAAGTTATRTARRPQAVNPPFKAVVFSRGVEGFYALDVTAI